MTSLTKFIDFITENVNYKNIRNWKALIYKSHYLCTRCRAELNVKTAGDAIGQSIKTAAKPINLNQILKSS